MNENKANETMTSGTKAKTASTANAARRYRFGARGLSLIGAGVLLGTGATFAATSAKAEDRPEFSVRYADVTLVTDVSDDKRLAGIADDVFIGKVSSRKGQRLVDGLPETQWVVTVERTLKGTLSGTISVNQQGGYDPDDNSLVLLEGDSYLAPGQRYMFSTKGTSHTLVPGYGDVSIPGAAPGSGAPAEETQPTDEMVERFTDAIDNQVPYEVETAPEPTDTPTEEEPDGPTATPSS